DLVDNLGQPVYLVECRRCGEQHQLIAAGILVASDKIHDRARRCQVPGRDLLGEWSRECVVMTQVRGATLGGPVAKREVAHAPEGRTPRPAEVGPGGESFRRRASEGARWPAAMHVAVAVPRHPSERLATRSADEQIRASPFRCRANFPLFPDVAD